MSAALGLATLSLALADEGHSGHYVQTNLVSDVAGLAAATDANLVNPWGLSHSATSPWWVSDNGTGLSTLYDGTGKAQALVVTVPNTPGATDPSAPTGTVFNASPTDFMTPSGTPARFLFATENGTIAAWGGGTSAVLVVNNGGKAVYKGLATAQRNGANFLYAANFMTGMVDVFDSHYAPVQLGAGAFHDPRLPANYAPFGVQSVGDMIVVAFAQTEAGSIDEVHGAGKGRVDIFTTDGVLRKRLEWGAWFNAPWGIALAPDGFGRLSHRLLVGQFGSGKIAAFDLRSGRFVGLLRGANGRPLMIEGLWALSFGNGANAGPANTLFFTAGIDDEAHGLFGTITPAADNDDKMSGDKDGHAGDDGDGK